MEKGKKNLNSNLFYIEKYIPTVIGYSSQKSRGKSSIKKLKTSGRKIYNSGKGKSLSKFYKLGKAPRLNSLKRKIIDTN